MLDRADVDELRELFEDRIALIAESVGDAGRAALGGDDLLIDVGDLFREVVRVSRETFEAEIEIKGKIYLIEVAESGYLLSKSLEAGEE